MSLNNLPNLDVYATKEELGRLEASIPNIDVNNYYTKAETYNKTEIDSAIANVDVDLSNFYTKSEVKTYEEIAKNN